MSTNFIHVPLNVHTTRDGHEILRPSNMYEYDATALLKAKTLLAFFRRNMHLEQIDMELDEFVTITIPCSHLTPAFHCAETVRMVTQLILQTRGKDIAAVISTIPYGQRHEQPGVALVKKQYIDVFYNTFLKTAEDWLDKNRETEEQLDRIFMIT